MATIRQIRFSGGELAPAHYSGVDLTRYASGLRTCRNGWIPRSGGYQNRPGTSFIAEVQDSTKTVRLVPFILNASQAYLFEFGNNYIRFFRDGSQILEATKTITGATQASPCVITTSGAHGYSTGQEVYISGVSGMTQINGRNFKVTSLSATTFAIRDMPGADIDSSSYSAYTSGGTSARVYELTTTYTEAQLRALQFSAVPTTAGGTIMIVHPAHAPAELTRTSDTSWALANTTFGPTATAPSMGAPSIAGTTNYYVATGINSTTLEESLASGIAAAGATPISLTITAAANTRVMNIFKRTGATGVFGYIGVSTGTGFDDTGFTPDTSHTPPESRTLFNSSTAYPACVAFYQQRLLLAASTDNPATAWTSRSGLYKNFLVSYPSQDDDAVTFSLIAKQAVTVRHVLDLGRLVILTDSGEWAIQGDNAGTLTPTAINPKQYTYNGASVIPPIVTDGTALYVQARASIIRDLAYDIQADGYRGNDLTTFSTHLFDGYTILDLAHHKIPNSIAWAVRSDGTLLGLTYIREQQIAAWHRHDTDGTFENVCAVPEGSEDAVYVVVNRTIGGVTKRYIERFNTRDISDIRDAVFMDAALAYDGRNTGSTTMTLSGGNFWTHTETLTLTASSATFVPTDVGNEIQITAGTYDPALPGDGTVVRFRIHAYTSSTVVTGRVNRRVPDRLISETTTAWARAVDTVSGLWHLEGKEVSVLGDGFVVGSPYNDAYGTLTVTNGAITLDKPYAVITVGLPYISDLETLDIDTDQGETLMDKKKLISKVNVRTEKTRGFFVGAKPPTDDETDALEGLTETKIRNDEGYDEPVNLTTDVVEVLIAGEWNSNGRVFCRQVDPLPVAINSIAPSGVIPFRR